MKELWLFINPAGTPCKMQNDILDLNKYLLKEVEIVIVKTTIPTDMMLFINNNITALPALIVKEGGRELYRFEPGVKQVGVILDKLKELE